MTSSIDPFDGELDGSAVLAEMQRLAAENSLLRVRLGEASSRIAELEAEQKPSRKKSG